MAHIGNPHTPKSSKKSVPPKAHSEPIVKRKTKRNTVKANPKRLEIKSQEQQSARAIELWTSKYLQCSKLMLQSYMKTGQKLDNGISHKSSMDKIISFLVELNSKA